jgi:hypothetical protein
MVAALFVCALAPQLRATGPSQGEKQCSNADLRGSYSFVASGTFGTAPFATAGRTTYDGDGNLEGVIQVSVNGRVMPRAAWTGTYSVDPATCTAIKTATIPGLGAVDFFVTFGDGFRELRFIATTQGATISGSAKKQ